ncbi:antibiotic biosynthesis monooxygenase [Sphingomonas sp. G-3-2-10]|uniref:antibiotic biosynthesis monooxygenase family protein n=1 Tax=Sphingomonas sp. G-3-2-10 TaxID=2728838 RepID=UPI00146A6508|nr:antibiotic biosynthesis monooxygenase [Sphingomonas sp. G-3-2-10]NML07365.1 antibiotic biosynthesis monooxygenase [Sphingomonas sp. G-3-2-10]
MELRKGQIAVIFVSQRTGADPEGYADAAEAMATLAAAQPGYCGVDSVRDGDGLGITVSYWADHESAVAWRNDAEHAQIRDRGRGIWYASYDLFVTEVVRGYDWRRP